MARRKKTKLTEAEAAAVEGMAEAVHMLGSALIATGINGGAIASALVLVAVQFSVECRSQGVMADMLREYADLAVSGMLDEAAGNA